MKSDYQVVIVGAGVGGALTAYRLAKAGLSVLMLEAGPRVASRPQMAAAYAIATNRGTLHNPYVDAEADQKAPSPDSSPGYYDQASPATFKSTYERRVGGATWHWLGHTPRLISSDFEMRTRYGGGEGFPDAMVDWPISYADLEPLYCEAEAELGVSGSQDEWNGLFGSPRSKPFPMSMIWPSYSDLWVADRINGESYAGPEFGDARYQVRSTPSARNSTLYDGRPPCAGNSICVPVCPIGAKYDGQVHVTKALAAGASLWDRCVVTRLDADADGRVHTVHFKTYGGAEQTVTGEVVVVAANAIETPKLLLMSDLANRSDQVGRNLMDHLARSAFGLAPEPLYPFRGPPSTSGIETFRDGDFRKEFAGFRVSLDNDGWSRKGTPATEILELVGQQRLIGEKLQSALFDRVSRQLRLSCSVEIAPDANNRVQLSTQTDSFGIPRPQITFAAPKYSFDGLTQAVKVMADIFQKIGATEVDLGPDGSYDGAGHIMGTCRMGADPGTSVVDPDGRTHDHRNLFVVGSSVFPTVGSPNPTLTLAALALRTVKAIGQDLGGKA